MRTTACRTSRTAAACAAITLLAAAGGGGASAMTVREYLDLPPPDARGGPLDQRRYLTGFRDGLYDFGLVLGSLGVQVFCVPSGTPPLDLPEFRRRLDAQIAAKRKERPDFEAYARDTRLGVIGLEFLAADYPCDTVEGGAGQQQRRR